MKITLNRNPDTIKRAVLWTDVKVGDMFTFEEHVRKNKISALLIKINNNEEKNALKVGDSGISTFGLSPHTNYAIVTDISVNDYISTIPA